MDLQQNAWLLEVRMTPPRAQWIVTRVRYLLDAESGMGVSPCPELPGSGKTAQTALLSVYRFA
jgi:hypothetical protein